MIFSRKTHYRLSGLDQFHSATSLSRRLANEETGVGASKVMFGQMIDSTQGIAICNRSYMTAPDSVHEMPWFHTALGSTMDFFTQEHSGLARIDVQVEAERYGGILLLGYLLRKKTYAFQKKTIREVSGH